MVRKSKLIGQTIGDFYIIDSIHIPNDTRLKVKCVKCGHEQEKNRKSVVKNTCECEKCGNGRKRRNASGHYGEPIYNRYMEILRRLKHHEEYKNVTMCKEWQDDFMAFYEWAIANGYRDDLTIDRIDNKKGYEPSNCRWVTAKEQANNRTNNIVVEYKGEKLTLAQLAEKYNLNRHTVYNRYKYGWCIDDIVNKPIDVRKISNKKAM